ncbi:MAG: c-type cytochrome [Proteobacteria bacterium]|nr:c-type cytochrome [Pseudomonadota bacterium]
MIKRAMETRMFFALRTSAVKTRHLTLAGLLSAILMASTGTPAAGQVTPDWSRGVAYPLEGRSNPYGLEPAALEAARLRGGMSVLFYPVEVTGSLIPLRLLEAAVDPDDGNPIRALLKKVIGAITGIRSIDGIEAWLGLVTYPDAPVTSPNPIPFPDGKRPEYRMGTTIMETADGPGMTFGCPACHTGELFGQRVMGLPNRTARANRFFVVGDSAVSVVPPELLGKLAGAGPGDVRMLERLGESVLYIEAKTPLTAGMDTSLAQVALSLSHRARDPWATRDRFHGIFPRHDRLRYIPADSRPAPWWNVKYKNRWLLDGSVVSGNPILTNILWNELGRGTDLHELEQWILDNQETIRDLTTYVMSAEAPRYTDFFAANEIDVPAAMRGKTLFDANCARCHGTYDKGWQRDDAATLTPEELIKTTRVRYHEQTPVIDVGTDRHRSEGMSSLEQLNDLHISQQFGIVIEKQDGYVPPPLVGVWARWPYFHNGSAPTLCAVLTRAKDRPNWWWVGPAVDPDRDFDRECNGFPAASRAPAAWRTNENLYRTWRAGLGNRGHDEGIFLRDGREIYSPEEKMDIITFLKTL